jgi:hypothetical protein
VKLNYPLTLSDYKSALKLNAWPKAQRCSEVSMFSGAVLAMEVLSAGFSVVLPLAGDSNLLATQLPFDAGLLWLTLLLSLLRPVNTRSCFKQSSPPKRTVRNRQTFSRGDGRDWQC